MTTVYRITSRDGSSIGEANSIDGIVELVKGAQPGQYQINRLSLEPATGDLRSWELGTITKTDDGLITLDLPPWID